MPSRFLVIGSQRSGTTVTQTVLLNHPQVSMPNEETRASALTEGYRAYTFGRELYPRRCELNWRLFDALALSNADESTETAGVKVALDNADLTARLVLALREYYPGVRVLHVIREDLVAQFASLMRARQTGVWHVRGAETSGEPVRLTLDVEAFVAYAADAIRTRSLLAMLSDDRPCETLVFEQAFTAGGPFDARPLCEFLQVDVSVDAKMGMRKVSPPVEEFVENVPELRAAFASIEAPPRGELERSLLAILREEAEGEWSIRVLVERARRWQELGWFDAADLFLEESLARLQRGEEGGQLRHQVALAILAVDRPLAGLEPGSETSEGVYAEVAALRSALREPGQRDPALRRLALQPWTMESLADLAVGSGRLAIAEGLLSAALHAGRSSDDQALVERCCGRLEQLWIRLADPGLAERRLLELEDRLGGQPAFHLLGGLVARHLGGVEEARTAFQLAADGAGPAAERARQALVELDG